MGRSRNTMYVRSEWWCFYHYPDVYNTNKPPTSPNNQPRLPFLPHNHRPHSAPGSHLVTPPAHLRVSQPL